MYRRLYGTFAVVLACFAVFSAGTSVANSIPPKEKIIATVGFSSITPDDKLAMDVYNLWMKLPEYQDSVKNFDMPPTFFTGYADINEDGSPEIFAAHFGPQYCDPVNDLCRVHVYTKSPKGLVEVARFMSGKFVGVAETKRKNVHDLVVSGNNKLYRYVWNGRVYEQRDR